MEKNIWDVYGGLEKREYLNSETFGKLGTVRTFEIEDVGTVEYNGVEKVRLVLQELDKKGKETGKEFYFTLNKTNARKLKEAGLESEDDLLGVEIEITSMLVSFRGKEVPGLRITKVSL